MKHKTDHKTKQSRNYQDRFLRYTQARERNRKAACRDAGERLKAAVSTGQVSSTELHSIEGDRTALAS